MKKIVLSAVLAVLCFAEALSQVPELPAQCKVWLPQSIDKEVINKKDAYALLRGRYGQSPEPAEKSYWIVFSDRDSNPTYATPRKGAAVCSELRFNERLIVAKIDNGYALVYREPKTEKYPNISSAAESKGWVPLDHLLLWTKGLADDADISYKAVICANLNVSGNDTTEGNLYKNPTGSAVGQLRTDMHFYFIMKEEGQKVLLGQYSSLATDSEWGLYGWVDKNSYVPWNQRTCLEPTWDRSNVEWFAANGKKWQVFSNMNKMRGKAPAEAAFSSTKTRDVSDQYSSEYKYRTMPANRLRYPILEGCTADLYHCSSFGTLGEKSEVVDVDAEVREGIANIEDTKIINIGIVIDGTSSMKPYFESVKNAIVEGCKYFGTNNQVNVAVAIYRDKEDGQYVFESFPSAGGFTDNPNNQNLKRFLDTGGKYGVKSVAKGETESVYYGVKKAVETFNFNPKQSNLLLVVGDCGDNGKMGVKREEIINLLAEKKISLMAFQVRNKAGDAYQTFNTQMTYIMKQSLQRRYNDQSARVGNVSKAVVKAEQLKDGSGWDIYNGNKSSTDLYRYVHRRNPALGKDMDVKQLTAIMENTIGQWNERIKYLRGMAQNTVDGIGFDPNDDGDGTLTDAIVDLFGGDRDRYERIRRSNSLTSFRGYTYKREPASQRELYKVVVFLPAPELKTLVSKLEPVYRVARNRSNDRRPYFEAMTTLAGSLIAQDEIKDVKYKEIIAKVFGLDSATTELGGPSLVDIVDPNAVSQQEYLNLVNKMKMSYEKLLRIMGEDYPFIYETAGSSDKYYWLPSEYLPL